MGGGVRRIGRTVRRATEYVRARVRAVYGSGRVRIAARVRAAAHGARAYARRAASATGAAGVRVATRPHVPTCLDQTRRERVAAVSARDGAPGRAPGRVSGAAADGSGTRTAGRIRDRSGAPAGGLDHHPTGRSNRCSTPRGRIDLARSAGNRWAILFM